MLINTIGTLLSLIAGSFVICKTTTLYAGDDGKVHIRLKWIKALFLLLLSAVLITILQYLLGTVLPIDIA